MNLNIFKIKKKNKRNELLLKEFEDGKILQINNNIDNKEYFKKIDNDRLKPAETENN